MTSAQNEGDRIVSPNLDINHDPNSNLEQRGQPALTSSPASHPITKPANDDATTNEYFNAAAAPSATNFSLEPNPFEQSFGNVPNSSTSAPNNNESTKSLLPPLSSIATPSVPGASNGAFPFNNSLRSGPLSPAMLAGPANPTQNGYLDSISRGIAPNESSLRNGLTPGPAAHGVLPPSNPGVSINSLFSSVPNANNNQLTEFPRNLLDATGRRSASVGSLPVNSSSTTNPALQSRVEVMLSPPQQQQQQRSQQQSSQQLQTKQEYPDNQPEQSHPSQSVLLKSQSVDQTSQHEPPESFNNNHHHHEHHAAADAANGLFMLSKSTSQKNSDGSHEKYPQPSMQLHGSNGAGGHNNHMSSDDENVQDNLPMRKGSKRKTSNQNSRRKSDAANKRVKSAEFASDESFVADETMIDGRKMTEDEKRKSFLERNRLAALKCRQRKKQWLASLQEKVEITSNENEALSAVVGDLRQELINVKTLLLEHQECSLTHQHQQQYQQQIQQHHRNPPPPNIGNLPSILTDPALAASAATAVLQSGSLPRELATAIAATTTGVNLMSLNVHGVNIGVGVHANLAPPAIEAGMAARPGNVAVSNTSPATGMTGPAAQQAMQQGIAGSHSHILPQSGSHPQQPTQQPSHISFGGAPQSTLGMVPPQPAPSGVAGHSHSNSMSLPPHAHGHSHSISHSRSHSGSLSHSLMPQQFPTTAQAQGLPVGPSIPMGGVPTSAAPMTMARR